VKQAEVLLLRESPAVKDLIRKEGKPTFLERYRLLRVKESRRDLFLDPRRRTGKVGEETVGDTRELEAVQLEALRILYEKARLELESFREAEKLSTDFLRRSAAKRAFLTAFQQLESEIQRVSRRSPEFSSRDIQDRYQVEVKRPYELLTEEAKDVTGVNGPATGVTEDQAKGYLKELQFLSDGRKFTETVDKWLAIETLLRDAGKNVEEGARPHITEMRRLGEHAQYQSLLAQRKIQVQGVVQMNKRAEPVEPGVEPTSPGGEQERVSAVIVNGRFLKPGEYLDKDLVFRGVDVDGRLLFTFLIKQADTGATGKHNVDYVQPQPDLLQQGTADLGQD
jgi:hypothetical protein